MSVSAAAPIAGTGKYTYRIVSNWAKVPKGYTFDNVAAVAVDANDRVYVFSRGNHPVMVFDSGGVLLTSWGEGLFKRPHGLHIGPDDTIFCTDDGDHTVRQCTLDGKVLLEIGIPGKPSGFMSGEPFNRCTHTALSPQREIYVSDGYANARVHKYTPEGKLLLSWGECGSDPGEFNVPHNIVCDAEGWVYVADRENHRIQVFDADGNYETQWNNLHRPIALALHGDKGDEKFYVAESGPHQPVNVAFPNLGPRLSILDKQGARIARVDERSGLPHAQFTAPHGIAVDSSGAVYIAEVSRTVWEKYLHPGEPFPPTVPTLQKLIPVEEPAMER